jgi:hypothetical protein
MVSFYQPYFTKFMKVRHENSRVSEFELTTKNQAVKMPKRKDLGNEDPSVANDEGSDDEDLEILDVDFEFFEFKPEIDFHGLKSLSRQLFDIDAQLFDLSALADHLLSQIGIGTTIKCDGVESDPYAFLTVLNLKEHQVCHFDISHTSLTYF